MTPAPAHDAHPAVPPARRWRSAVLCLVLSALLFRGTLTILLVVFAAWLIHRILFRRDRRLLLCAVSAALSFAAFEFVGGRLLERQIGRTMELSVDHRLKPNAAAGINSDGLRCPVDADDFTADTFNVLLLGDSFTYGLELADARDTMPARLEALIRERHPAARVRTVNFGWPSSSPLLTFHLLRDVGAKYKPKLVIQCLDMTDFHDDLRYARATRLGPFSPTHFLLERAGLGWVWSELRDACRLTRPPEEQRAIPENRYFIVNQPLAKSLPLMRETELNLRRIHELCSTQLHVPFILVMMPRGFQYSDRESPRNWEGGSYVKLGPWVQEPFRWLDSLRRRAPFPCHSLLDDFKNSGVFPTCLEDDPHWTRAGCEVAARGVLNILEQEGHLAPTP